MFKALKIFTPFFPLASVFSLIEGDFRASPINYISNISKQIIKDF